MKIVFQKSIILLLVFSIIIFSGCNKKGSKSLNLDSCDEYVELIEEIDDIIDSYSLEGIESDLLQEFNKASAERKSEIALDFADDIARINFLGVSNSDMLGIAGNMVKAYPHPLLLNNFGVMVLEEKGPDEALYFLLLSAAQNPDDPVILTNLANVYLELEYYEEAKLYAERALTASNDYGPAYQILTTLHLKDDNSPLAAETMIKSAKYCFNDISVYHFNSFLNAVSQLDPKEDDYPLNEAFLDELYIIAKENTGSFTDVSTDNPDSQLTLKEFPPITGPENLMKSEEYFDKLFSERHEKESEINWYYEDYLGAADEYLGQVEYSFSAEQENVYPIYTYARQICAIRVLDSFYRFELYRLYEENQDDIKELLEKMWNEIHKIEDEYLKRQEEWEEKAEEYSDQALGEIFAAPLGADSDLGQGEAKKSIEAAIQVDNLEVEKQNAVMQKIKSYSNDVVNKCHDYYNEQKIILEEYWLRYGGLLKYIEDFDAYMCLSAERERMIYSFVTLPIHPVDNMGGSLRAHQEILDQAKADLEFTKSAFKDYINNNPQPEPKEDEPENSEQGDPNFSPDIEREAISEFKESSDMGEWGLELAEPIFGLANVSASYDGEKLSVEYGSILGGGKVEYNTSDGTFYNHKLYGTTAMGNTGWFKDTSVVKSALKKSGVLGQAVKSLGDTSFSYSDKSGIYIEKNRANTLTDTGIIHVRESGGTIGNFGKSKKITVKKSLMSGVAIKSTTTKYKFMFGSFEY